jgi:hypothetical protein
MHQRWPNTFKGVSPQCWSSDHMSLVVDLVFDTGGRGAELQSECCALEEP